MQKSWRSKRLVLWGLLLVVGSRGGASFAEEPSVSKAKGPHGGIVLEKEGSEYEIEFNEDKEAVHIYNLTLRPEAPRKGDPQELALEFKSSDGKKRRVLLRSVEPWRGHPHFEGSLRELGDIRPSAGSAMGFELKFEFNGQKKRSSPKR
jgi:hypothetical protein